MKVNYFERIQETSQELKRIMKRQKTVTNVRKVQSLYLLKSLTVQSITDVAQLLGVHRITVQRWLKQYSNGGLCALLKVSRSTGRPRVIQSEIVEGISKKIATESGEIKSYKELVKWVEKKYHTSVKYATLYKQVHYRMKAKLKVPRRSSNKKEASASIEFKKKLEKLLKVIWWLECNSKNPAKKGLKYWCGDETRIGLKTIERKKLTAFGVKPIGTVQWNFKAYYLYGVVAPETGESFWL